VFLPSSKFDPILRTFRVIKFRPRKSVKQSENLQQAAEVDISEPEKCVNCEVLYDPSPEPIRADVIFIHGLHGSLDKTWKQGSWDVRKVRTVPVRRRHSQPAPHGENISQPRLSRNGSFAEGNERGMDLAGNSVRRPSSATTVIILIIIQLILIIISI
jgi:hypothetical protein